MPKFKITLSFSLPSKSGDFDLDTIKKNAEALIIMASENLNEEDKLLDYSYEGNFNIGRPASDYEHISEYHRVYDGPTRTCLPCFELFFEKTFVNRPKVLTWAHKIQKSILELWESKKEELKGDIAKLHDIAIEEITEEKNK